MVDKFANINPSRIFLRGLEGETLRRRVTIKPTEKYPFRILSVKSNGADIIAYQLDQADDGGKPVYFLIVENIIKTKGYYAKNIILETDSPQRPEIRIPVYVQLLEN